MALRRAMQRSCAEPTNTLTVLRFHPLLPFDQHPFAETNQRLQQGARRRRHDNSALARDGDALNAILGAADPFSHSTESSENTAPHTSQTAGWAFTSPIDVSEPHWHCTATSTVSPIIFAGSSSRGMRRWSGIE